MPLAEIVVNTQTRQLAANRRRGSSMARSSETVSLRALLRSSVRRSATCAIVLRNTRQRLGGARHDRYRGDFLAMFA